MEKSHFEFKFINAPRIHNFPYVDLPAEDVEKRLENLSADGWEVIGMSEIGILLRRRKAP